MVLPWVELYRPNVLNDVKGHSEIIGCIKSFLEKGNIPHLLFFGPQGTGKTSLAKVIVREVHGDRAPLMVLELNASDDRGINVIRERVKTFAETVAARSSRSSEGLNKYFKTVKADEIEGNNVQSSVPVGTLLRNQKFIILDECDQMTTAAQTALRRIMELHAKNVCFLLICNEVSKISPPIQSRCCSFKFSPIGSQDIKRALLEVVEKRNMSVTDEAIDILITEARGDMRTIYNLLQQASMCTDGKITQRDIIRILGLPDKEILDNAFTVLMTRGLNESIGTLTKILDSSGYCFKDLVVALHSRCIDEKLENPKLITLIPRLVDLCESHEAGVDLKALIRGLSAAFIEMKCISCA